MNKSLNWENTGNRAVRVRDELVEPGESIEIEDPSPAEQKMFGEAPKSGATKRKPKGKQAAEPAAKDS